MKKMTMIISAIVFCATAISRKRETEKLKKNLEYDLKHLPAKQ